MGRHWRGGVGLLAAWWPALAVAQAPTVAVEPTAVEPAAVEAVPVASAAAVELTAVVLAAAERDPSVRAAGVRFKELAGAAEAAQGQFDLVGDFGLSWNQQRTSARDQTEKKVTLDTQRLSLDAAVVQPLVWGTLIRASWTNEFTSTDNPFLNCVPGVASDQCFESRLELSVTQPLLRGFGRTVNTLAETRVDADTEVARARKAATAANVVQAVVLAWVELSFAEADVRIRQRALELAATQERSARRQVEGGRLAPVDLAVVEQAVAERTQALFVAEQRAAERRAEILLRSGVDVPSAALPAPFAWEADAVGTAAAAEAANPDLKVLDAQVTRQTTELPALRDRTRAQLDLAVSAAQSGLDKDLGGAIAALPDNDSAFYGASLSLTFPFQNRTAEGELYQAEQAVERAHLERAAQVQAIQLTADSALRALRTAEQAQVLAETVARLAEKSLAAEQRRLELGRATQLDVLGVQQKSAEADLAVERARTDRVAAATRLLALTGHLLDAFGLQAE